MVLNVSEILSFTDFEKQQSFVSLLWKKQQVIRSDPGPDDLTLCVCTGIPYRLQRTLQSQHVQFVLRMALQKTSCSNSNLKKRLWVKLCLSSALDGDGQQGQLGPVCGSRLLTFQASVGDSSSSP